MAGSTAAPWFVEVNGQKQGPFTNQQIVKLLMDGALKVDSRIFDSSENAWKIAADVIPYLDATEQKAPPKSAASVQPAGWTPPPRPVELKNVHVVDLQSERTGEVDYFALINEQRKNAAKNASPGLTSVASPRSVAVPTRKLARTPTAQNRKHIEESHRIENRGIRLTAAESAPSASGNPVSAGEVTEKPTGLLVAEVQPEIGFGIDNVILFTRRVRRLAKEHKNSLAIAASLAFVFVGTFGMVRFLSDHKGREPANANLVGDAASGRGGLASAPALGSLGADDALGNHRNPVHRPHGTSITSTKAPVTPILPPRIAGAAGGAAGDPPRDPPQYYSTSMEEPQGTTNLAGQPTAPAAPTPANPSAPQEQNPQAAPDPNAGIVVPPTLNPQQNDPNEQNR